MQPTNRPLSPHLQIYKPQLTSVLSITHRATGVFLTLGSFLLIYWLVSLSMGPASYAQAQACFASWPGKLLLIGVTFSVFYHLCNGIRHLFWDAGLGFEIETVYRSGWAVVIVSCLATLVFWIVDLSSGGSA